MTTRTFAEPLGLIALALAVLVPAAAAAQPRSIDVRDRLDFPRWPVATATFAGLEWARAAAELGLDVVSTDVRPLDRGAALVRLGDNGRARWLVRVAVAPNADDARRVLLRWAQPVQGALDRSDASIATADVVLVDDGGGRARAGLVAGNVALWVSAADGAASGALDVLRALAARLVTRASPLPSLRLVSVAQPDPRSSRRTIRVVASASLSPEIAVDGGYVAGSDRDRYDVVLSSAGAGARVRAIALDALGRIVTAEIVLAPLAP